MNDSENNLKSTKNKQLYKRTFSILHTDHALNWDVLNMKKYVTVLIFKRSFIIVTAVLTLIFAMTCISYAATDGQLLDTIKVWFNGQLVGDGSYTLNEDGSYTIELQENSDVSVEGEGFVASSVIGNMKGSMNIKEDSTDGENGVACEMIIDEITSDVAENTGDAADSTAADN